jgi:putative membrane protein
MNKIQCATLLAALFVLSSVSVASAKSSKEFLTDAIQGNLGEISVGQLAQKNGDSAEVRDFGQMLVQDHSANNDKAKSLAESEGVTLPTEPKPEAKQVYDKLSRLSGAAFDREFAKAMVKDHKKDIKEFEGQAKSNDDVGKFAQDTLPTLKKHLQTAQSLSQRKAASP